MIIALNTIENDDAIKCAHITGKQKAAMMTGHTKIIGLDDMMTLI